MNFSEETYRPEDKPRAAESSYIIDEGIAEDDTIQPENGRESVNGSIAEPGQMSNSTVAAHDEAGVVGSAESDIQRLSRERDEYLDLARRTQADYENYRKRVMRQQVEESTRYVQELIVKLLPVLDAFSIAEMHLGGNEEMDPDTKALLQSGSMLFDVLAAEGVERIDQVGVPFDPTVHEAIEHSVTGRRAKEHPATESHAQGHRTNHTTEHHAKEPHGKAQHMAAQVHQDERDDRPSSDVSPEGADSTDHSHEGGAVVTGVFRAGYRWKGRVLRPAMVKVEE